LIASKPILIKEGKEETLIIYDLETQGLNATLPVFGCTKNYHTGDERTFSCMIEMRSYLEANAPCIAYAHRGTSFDVFGLLSKDECYNAPKIISGTTIFEMKHNGVCYRDSKQLIPISISDLAESVKMEKGETPKGFIDGTITSFDQVTQEMVEYCLIDCRILVEGLRQFKMIWASLIGMNPHEICFPLTIASMAYRTWCEISWPTIEQNPRWYWTDSRKRVRKIARGHKDINEIFRDCEHGGRVQVFRSHGIRIGEKEGGIVTYDENSVYGAVMLNPMPDPTSARHIGPTYSALRVCLSDARVVCAAKVRIIRPDASTPPMLPGTDAEGRKDWNVFEYHGWLCEPELKLMLEIGYVIESVEDIIACRAIRPFDRFVQTLYALRLEMQRNNDPAQRLVKLLLCSCFGRFGIKERPARVEGHEAISKAQERDDYLERYEMCYYDGIACEYPYLLDYNSMRRAPASQFFGFSSFILSYGRAALMRGIIAAGDSVIYCDTDSVHLTIEGQQNFENEMKIGSGLGEWKLETPEPVHSAIYWESKAYSHYNEDGSRRLVKHKGVRVRDEEGEWYEHAGDLTQPQITRSVLTLYDALRRGLEPGTELVGVKRSRRFCLEESQ
jgi:hypothetical protein